MRDCCIEAPLPVRLACRFKVSSTLQQHIVKGCTMSDLETQVARQIAALHAQTVSLCMRDVRQDREIERALVCNHVSYQYAPVGRNVETFALRDVSFVIGRGEFVGIAGRTGSGKSTLLQLMNGILKPGDGSIYFDGQDIWEDTYSRGKLRQKIGLVFQYPEQQLFEETVYKDVVFGPYQLDISKVEAEKLAFEAIRDIGLPESVYDLSPLALSGGQRRKVALAGVLAMHPDYLVLDEPAAGLDPAGRRELMEYLRDLCDRKNMTVIMVSHSMEDIAEYTDRLLVMKDGCLIKDDTTRNCLMDSECMREAGLNIPVSMRMVQQLNQAGVAVQSDIVKEAELMQALGVIDK